MLSAALRFCFRSQQLLRLCFLLQVPGIWMTCSHASHPSWTSPRGCSNGGVRNTRALSRNKSTRESSQGLGCELAHCHSLNQGLGTTFCPWCGQSKGMMQKGAEDWGSTIRSTTAATSFALWCKLLVFI